mmetsp:Transcript_24736/g.36849  ORF Transcript_24736/g.36849 Transcript_24736/m.36849 type:complete len:193 (-) Transcript_24736:415-993(-)
MFGTRLVRTLGPIRKVNISGVSGTCIKARPFSSSTQQSFRERLSKLRRNGTPEIVFGVTLLGLLMVDQLLRDKQMDERKETVRRLQEVMDADDERLKNEVAEEREDTLSRPTMFKCVVRQVPAMFDGPRCLTGVENGDIVDVIEERVGPDGGYNLCRYSGEKEEGSKSTSENVEDMIFVGWFPTSCLQKLTA